MTNEIEWWNGMDRVMAIHICRSNKHQKEVTFSNKKKCDLQMNKNCTLG